MPAVPNELQNQKQSDLNVLKLIYIWFGGHEILPYRYFAAG